MKALILVQTFFLVSVMVYLGLVKWNLIDEQHNPIAANVMLTTFLTVSGFVGISSIYLFYELVSLIEMEKEYEIQTFQILQMQEVNDLLKSQKHDFSNNLQVIWGMLSLGNLDKAKEYLEEYTNTLKIDEEELTELRNIPCTYIYTLLLNKAYKCKDMGIEIYYNIQPFLSLEAHSPIDIVRILANLLDNAIYEVSKLERGRGAIYVDIFEDDDNYIFRVTNEGTIISEQIRDDIFKKGFTTKGSEGTGFGLYNVKELVEKYKGKIHIESDINIGTRFIINIPK